MLTDFDRRMVVKAIIVMRDLMVQPTGVARFDGEIGRRGVAQTDIEILAWAEAKAASYSRPGCTLAMGRVTANRGRAMGVDGIGVLGAPIFHVFLFANLNAPVIMMAEKVAAQMKC